MRLINAENLDVIMVKDKSKNFVDGMQYILDLLDNQPDIPAIPIPDNATNGDIIKALFPCEDLEEDFDSEWWNSPYKRGDTE